MKRRLRRKIRRKTAEQLQNEYRHKSLDNQKKILSVLAAGGASKVIADKMKGLSEKEKAERKAKRDEERKKKHEDAKKERDEKSKKNKEDREKDRKDFGKKRDLVKKQKEAENKGRKWVQIGKTFMVQKDWQKEHRHQAFGLWRVENDYAPKKKQKCSELTETHTSYFKNLKQVGLEVCNQCKNDKKCSLKQIEQTRKYCEGLGVFLVD